VDDATRENRLKKWMLNEPEILSNKSGSASRSHCRIFARVRDHQILLSYNSAGSVHFRPVHAVHDTKPHFATEDAARDDQAADAHTPQLVRLHSSFVTPEYFKCDQYQQNCLAKRIT
jgi:hypothetical protein